MLTPETEKASEEGLLDSDNVGKAGIWEWDFEEGKAFLHGFKTEEVVMGGA